MCCWAGPAELHSTFQPVKSDFFGPKLHSYINFLGKIRGGGASSFLYLQLLAECSADSWHLLYFLIWQLWRATDPQSTSKVKKFFSIIERWSDIFSINVLSWNKRIIGICLGYIHFFTSRSACPPPRIWGPWLCRLIMEGDSGVIIKMHDFSWVESNRADFYKHPLPSRGRSLSSLPLRMISRYCVCYHSLGHVLSRAPVSSALLTSFWNKIGQRYCQPDMSYLLIFT